MRVLDLSGRNIAIWGTGVEGLAAARYIRRILPGQNLVFLDEKFAPSGEHSGLDPNDAVITTPGEIERALDSADVLVKSPGISLRHPAVQAFRAQGKPITSLLNLWAAEARRAKTIFVTGTKGKSTTVSLLGHVLNAMGHSTAVGGNIGTPVTEMAEESAQFAVVEVSSYQAADFDAVADIGVLVSLFPEHFDWHGDLITYYRDKLNLIARSRTRIVSAQAAAEIRRAGLEVEGHLAGAVTADSPDGFHTEGSGLLFGRDCLGRLTNAYLCRPHNLANVCVALAVARELGFDPAAALAAMESFHGLPHRQDELGERDGILFVDDSISTTPQSAVAAIEVYKSRPIAVIVGGFDRGLDYRELADCLVSGVVSGVVCMGPSGERIAALLAERSFTRVKSAATMTEAVALAASFVPRGGVVLLSPAAPSYGLFKNFEERGRAFAKEAGLPVRG